MARRDRTLTPEQEQRRDARREQFRALAQPTPHTRTWRVGTSGQTVIVNDEATQEGYSFSVPYPADARLIAAAPRMLEALATLTAVIDRGSDGRLDEFDRDLTAALAEARALLRDIHGEN